MAEPKTIVGYADRIWARPGDDVSVMVSQHDAAPYDATLVRLWGCDSLSPGGVFEQAVIAHDGNRRYPGRRQRLDPGSFAHADLRQDLSWYPAWTFSALFHPTTLSPDRQVLFACGASGEGAACEIAIDKDGRVAIALDGAVHETALRVRTGRWQRIALSIDRNSGTADITIVTVARRFELDNVISRQDERLVIASGAAASGGQAGGWLRLAKSCSGSPGEGFFGKIERPMVHAGARDREEERLLDPFADDADEDAIIVGWDFGSAIGKQAIAGFGRDAVSLRLHQMPSQAVTGCAWSGDCFDWTRCPSQYAAIHFHGDDLIDAQWDPDLVIDLPPELGSGVYAVRLDDGTCQHFVPFFVAPPKDSATASVAYLAATATYVAYANFSPYTIPELIKPEYRDAPSVLTRDLRGEASIIENPQFGLGHYHHHRDRDGVRHSSHRRPTVNFTAGTAPWGFAADGDILAWLKRADCNVDVLCDHLLHDEGVSLLAGYRVLITGTHPEYWSIEMMDALRSWIAGGGRLMYMGGNGFYWRVSFHPEVAHAIELRRAEDGTRAWMEEAGQYYHASDGRLGGLWRRLGQPPQALCGVGFSGQGFGGASHFRKTAAAADPRVAFMFEGVDTDVIGNFGTHGGGAVGEELDRAEPGLGTPSHALVVASSEDLHPSVLRATEELGLTQPTSLPDPDMRADMVFFETPSGGAVFSTGSISWASSLSHDDYDNSVSAITTNVLRRFADPLPFEVPERN